MNIWDDKLLLDRMELMRQELRLRGKRLTFDCLNLKCRGDRAHCDMGHLLGQANDGSLALITVLRGITSGMCLVCTDFNSEDDREPDPYQEYLDAGVTPGNMEEES